MDPYNNTREVFKFFGFTMHSRVSNFLDTHTKANIGGVSSTFRDSKTAPFKWRERLNEDEVYTIQDKCAEAMALWGYKSLTEKEDLKTFEPVYKVPYFQRKHLRFISIKWNKEAARPPELPIISLQTHKDQSSFL